MAAGLNNVLKHLRKVAAAENAEQLSDRQLVERFVAEGDEAAFAALVQRHGAMVLNVCWRVLQNDSDADDACQATFMVLARKAPSIRKRDSVASWLHGVAYRAASNLRKEIMRRHAREGQAAAGKSGPKSEVTWREVQTILDEEIQRLPEELKGPVLLCYLEGKTHNEGAQQLGWSLTTFRGRLERAREVLRKRLTQRGVALSGALLAAVLSERTASAAFSSALLKAALAGVTAKGVVSVHILSLAQGVIQAMFWNKLKIGVVTVLLAVITVGVGGLALHGLVGGGHAKESASAQPAPETNSEGNTRSKDPKAPAGAKAQAVLPDGAIIEVIGVGQHPSDGKAWWQADGTPLPKPVDTLSPHKEPPIEGQFLRELAIQVRKPAAASVDMFDSFFGLTADSGTNENLRIRRSISVPKGTQEMTIKIGYGGGDWKSIAEADNKGATNSKDVRFLPIERMPDGRGVVRVQHSFHEYQRQIVAIDNAGKRHISFPNSRQHTGPALKDEGQFVLATDDIQRVVLETRRYTWVEFRHVTLDPANKTRIEVWIDGKHEGKKADEKGDQPDQVRLQGAWKVVAEKFGGEDLPAERRGALVLSFAGDKVEYQTAAYSLGGTFKLALAPPEKSLDITLDGRVMRALYRLEGEKLRLAVGNPYFGNERPKDLISGKDDESKSVLTLERVPVSKEKAPAVGDEAAKEAAMKKARLQCGGNLHRLVQAMHKYVDDKNKFPPAATTDLAGKSLLSWRVALLPYLGEKELFDKFRQDEPWDSEHNLKLLPKMPSVFASVGNPAKTAHATFYQVFVGEDCLFERGKENAVNDVNDGTVATLAIIAAAEAVPWTKPADLAYDAGKPLPLLAGGMFDDALLSFATADGSVYMTPNTIDEKLLRALITRNGAEVIDLGSLRK